MKEKIAYSRLLPVMFGFFIMGFVDVVGISTSYVKQDFGLSDKLANLLPMMVFLWFAIFSVPTGIMMSRVGRKRTVLISMVITLIAMLVPLIAYEFTIVLIAFAMLGIGNTILQVSLNPLLTNVISRDKFTSVLTLGQFIKAIASLLGPIIAGVAASLGNWKLMFPLFAFITLISSVWLLLIPVKEESVKTSTSTFADCFRLLKDTTILMLFLGILFLVGIDVGLNTTVPKFLIERCHITLEQAGLANSLYFTARMVGSLIGALLLVKISGRKLLIVTMIAGIIALMAMLTLSSLWVILSLVFVLGLAVANVFPIIFSMALKKMPEQANEISGLLIMGVAGGAILPPIMGVVSDQSNQAGALTILIFAFAYLLYVGVKVKEEDLI